MALLAVAVLVLNDHVLKEVWPGVLTGKLSDVAGLVFFPLLLLAVIDLLGATRLARSAPARLVCVGLTGVAFSAIQLIPEAAQIYRHGLGWMQWPALALLAGAPSPQPVDHTMDPTDLLALPALLVAWRLASPSLTRHAVAGRLAVAAVAVLGSGCASAPEVRQTTLAKVESGTVTRCRHRLLRRPPSRRSDRRCDGASRRDR